MTPHDDSTPRFARHDADDTDLAPTRRLDLPAMPVVRSEDVLRGTRAVEILHAGLRYRLSVTALGKLILTK